MTSGLKQFLAGSDAVAVVTPVVEARLQEIKDHEELSCSVWTPINAVDAIVLIFNRQPVSQAGRRGFDFRLPLQFFQ